MPDGNVMVWLALAGLLVYGAHAGAVKIKHGVQHVFHKKSFKAIVQPIEHPKKDLKTVIRHETGA